MKFFKKKLYTNTRNEQRKIRKPKLSSWNYVFVIKLAQLLKLYLSFMFFSFHVNCISFLKDQKEAKNKLDSLNEKSSSKLSKFNLL